MNEMNEKLQQQLWDEAVSFVENDSRKNLAHLGVTLDGVDNQYMELSFTCKCSEEDYQDFVDIVDEEFLQNVRFEYSNIRISEFACDIPIEVSQDRDDWEHVIQLSVGDENIDIYNKFVYWQREHEKMTSGFRQSMESFDKIYLQSLKQMARHLGVDYAYDGGDDLYDEMIVIERAIHSFFEKGGN